MRVLPASQSSGTRKPHDRGPPRSIVDHPRLRPVRWTASLMTPEASMNHRKTPGKTPLPHLNFACNSPATLSNFESTSLKFRGFLNIANLSDHRIACEIGGASEEPKRRRLALRSGAFVLTPAQPLSHDHTEDRDLVLTPAFHGLVHELLSTFLSFDDRHMGEADGYTNCDGVRTYAQSCARSHFALQLLGF